jgi:hypothetical protein
MKYILTDEEIKELKETHARAVLDRDIVLMGIADTLVAMQEKRCKCETYDQSGEIDKRDHLKNCNDCVLVEILRQVEKSPYGKSNKVTIRDIKFLCSRSPY